METTTEDTQGAQNSQVSLAEGAEKFKGEYRDQSNERITSTIRDYPGKPELLAFTLKIGSREPGTVGFWYDEAQDVLSSKKADEQRNFSTLRLDEKGNQLIEVHHDWKNNTTDTTIYIRTH
ncbi:hypothetical protein GXP67_01245 [Rhodocytophaga rosea]|uniref:Uncharacterized protein n=1 Tax=Rhodocytophaga rosea TaxID=2704465 RepID=A0A6C0GBS7_9BACT|nr:hypothetical protein [Rhodocytophaga rosea]QHT65396.1 hypothetical protein GXP67_01245 [Rhodocytophaga rosea]